MTEEWCRVPGYDLIQVSSLGRVIGARGGLIVGNVDRKTGYQRIEARRDGKVVTVAVHTLVALAFVGPRPSEKHTAAHWDGNKTNNVDTNLRWATFLEQEEDKRRHGRAPKSEDCGGAKLTTAQVKAIRARYVFGSRTSGLKALGREFGVWPNTIWDIVNRRTWKDAA